MLIDIKLEDYFSESNQQPTEAGKEKNHNNLSGIAGSTAAMELPEPPAGYGTEVHFLLRSLMTQEFKNFQEEFREGMSRSLKDESLSPPTLTEAMGDIFKVQKEYLQLIDLFASLHQAHITPEQLTNWKQEVTTAFKQLILQFTVQHSKVAQRKIFTQQDSLAELCAPLILLSEQTGVLSLSGIINENEAKILHEKIMRKCCDANLENLFIDLSGVRMTDQRGVQQLIQLFDGLKILGVKTVLTGISPDTAKIFIQQNFNSHNIEISSTLIQALKIHNLKNSR